MLADPIPQEIAFCRYGAEKTQLQPKDEQTVACRVCCLLSCNSKVLGDIFPLPPGLGRMAGLRFGMDSLPHPERLSEFRAICEPIGIEMIRGPSVSLGQVIRQTEHTIDA